MIGIHSRKPLIRLRVGIYDSFWEIPVEAITGAPLEILTDSVKQEEERLEEIHQNPERQEISYICAEDHQFSPNQITIENL